MAASTPNLFIAGYANTNSAKGFKKFYQQKWFYW